MKFVSHYLSDLLSEFLFLKNGICPVCGKVLFVGDDFLCSECAGRKPLNIGPVCDCCGRALTEPEKRTCKHCRQAEIKFDGGFCLFHYQAEAKAMITALKFKNRPALGTYLGEEMAKGLKALPWISQVDLLIPIPIHPERRKERGYNQSEKIAEGIMAELAQSQSFSQVNQNLYRSYDNPHQIGQSLKKRQENMLGVFDLQNPSAVFDKNILLVDDVMTTGATLFEAAATLKEAGAGKIFVAVAAGLDDH
ncbi:ComF family protein [Eubacteriaceae bacterium ES2]|nr:ComF family protein [Eubacteriaceae bacterium ES2]